MSDQEPLTLPAIVAAASHSLADTTAAVEGGSTILSRGGRPFAILRAGTLSVRLGGELARVATRTRDTSPGVDGEGWVDFGPASIDQYAADRAASWIEAAWRRAG